MKKEQKPVFTIAGNVGVMEMLSISAIKIKKYLKKKFVSDVRRVNFKSSGSGGRFVVQSGVDVMWENG